MKKAESVQYIMLAEPKGMASGKPDIQSLKASMNKGAIPERVELKYVFPGDAGAPVVLMQPCLLYANVEHALDAVVQYVDATPSNKTYDTPEELREIYGNLREEQLRRQAAGESFWQSLHHKSSILPKRYLFRGQANWDWALLPSLFQGLNWGPLPWTIPRLVSIRNEIRARREVTVLFKGDLIKTSRGGSLMPNIAEFSQVQLELTARHYGFPSMFLDFTKNPKTAAFFATNGTNSKSIGVLYVLDLYRLNDAFKIAAIMPSGSYSLAVRFFSESIQLGNGMQVNVPTLSNMLFSMETVPLARVRAQDAVFLSITESSVPSYKNVNYIHDEYWAWYALDYISLKFCFRQTHETYQNEQSGITQQFLMPPDDALQEFASSWRAAH